MSGVHIAHPPAKPHVPNVNPANALTVLRIVLVPFFGYALLVDGGDNSTWQVVAAVLFVGAAITDRIDGQIARRYGLVTNFGKLADPIADKALIGTALVGLSILGTLPWWVTIVIGVREIGITVLRLIVLPHRVIPASRGGKAKTMAQSLAIFIYLLPLPTTFEWLMHLTMGVAVFLTVVTGIDYVISAVAAQPKRPRKAQV